MVPKGGEKVLGVKAGTKLRCDNKHPTGNVATGVKGVSEK